MSHAATGSASQMMPSVIQRHLESSRPVRWLFAGDSITQGAAHTAGWRDYTQLFKERLGEIGRNEDVMINTAVGGWTINQLVPRIDDRVLTYQPDVLFLMFGTNDAVGGAAQIDTFRIRYREAVHACRGQMDVIMQTTVPVCTVDPEEYAQMRYSDVDLRATKAHGLRMRQQFLSHYVDATRDVAKTANVLLIDHYSVWTNCTTSLVDLTDGGFHPNHLGHRLIATTLFSELGFPGKISHE